MTDRVRLLAKNDVKKCIGMSRAVELMDVAFRAISDGSVDCPVRTSLSNDSGTMLYKPAYLGAAEAFCVKVASVFPGNSSKQKPVTSGLVLVNDFHTGLPLALMDAEYLTGLRTGAASGLATRVLARQDVSVVALIGAGGQAAFQLEAMCEVLPLEEVYVFSRSRRKSEEFCEQMKQVAAPCRLIPTQDRSVLKDCGVICTATSSHEPVFTDCELGAGVHINGIGSYRPEMAEIPVETIQRSIVCVDQRAACLREAGDILQGIKNGDLPKDYHAPELGEVLIGRVAGRTSREQTTIFKSVGNAAQDIICAAEILKVAEEHGVGELFSFASA